MKLNNTVYKTIEIAEDEGYGMVVGNIVMDGDNMLYAEIVDSTICDHGELSNVRAFLDEVEDMMTTNTSNVSNVETAPIINEECVGCCKVVDVAAKLQKKLDEYKETILVERIDHDAEKKMINRKFCEDLRKLNAIIEELKQRIGEKNGIIIQINLRAIGMDAEIKERDALIEELKDRNVEDLNELYAIDKAERNKLASTIKDLNLELTKKRAIIDEITRLRVNEVEKTESLEAELSARKEDSAVLKKVVDEVKEWGDATSDPSSYTRRTNAVTLDRIAFIIKDCHDAPEDITDSGDNTSCTVKMDIRCE